MVLTESDTEFRLWLLCYLLSRVHVLKRHSSLTSAVEVRFIVTSLIGNLRMRRKRCAGECAEWWSQAETDGAAGQLGKHRTHFSVSASRQLGKHAGISVIDAFINKVIALFICISLMCLFSVQINLILNLYLFSQKEQQQWWRRWWWRWWWGVPSNLIPSFFCLLPSSVPSSFDYEDNFDTHAQQTTSLLLPDSSGYCGGGAPFFLRLSAELDWLLSIRDRLCHFMRISFCCCPPSTHVHTTEAKKKLKGPEVQLHFKGKVISKDFFYSRMLFLLLELKWKDHIIDFFFFFFIFYIEVIIHMFYFAKYMFEGIHWFPTISCWNENKLAGQLCNNKMCLYLHHSLHYCYREMQHNNVNSSETSPCNNNETDQK